jgi:AraC family transcriptional regulator
MPADFIHLRKYISDLRAPAPDGRLVFSELPKGSIDLGRPSLSAKVVLQGEERYEVDGRKAVLKPGSVLIVAPGQDCKALIGDNTAGLCIYLPQRAAVARPHPGEMSSAPILLPLIDHPFGEWVKSVSRTVAGEPDAGRRHADCLLKVAQGRLTNFIEIADRRGSALSVERPARRAELLRRVELARAFLHATPTRAVSLAELSEAAGLSAFHLSRCFRDVHGVPPVAYHRGYRLDLAAVQLRHGRKIVELVAEFGFADQTSFSRAFARKFGCSPGSLRPKRTISTGRLARHHEKR